MRSEAVVTRGDPGETYEDFTKRVAEDQARVNAKCAALDKFTPCCTACGETCDEVDAGARCKQNGMRMVSRWARELAEREWYRLGNFGGSWWVEVQRLAILLDRVRCGSLDAIETAIAGKGPTT